MAKVLLFCFINCLFIYGSLASQCSVYEGVGNKDNTFNDLFALDTLHNSNHGFMVDLHVSIDMGAEARIALTTQQNSTNPSISGDYILEIGAGGNRAIDLYKGAELVESFPLIWMLSSVEIQSFWIHILEDGFIEVGKESVTDPVFTYQDPNPLPIKYFGFGSYNSNAYKFYYNCSSNIYLPSHARNELPQCLNYITANTELYNETIYSLEYLNGASSAYYADFHFSVRATRGAVVEFLTSDLNGVYRIGLGTGYNKQCEVLKNGVQIFSSDCIGILSGSDIRAFYIQISKGGIIYIGKEYDENHLSFYDSDVLPVTDFRFSTKDYLHQSYFYNCTTDASLIK